MTIVDIHEQLFADRRQPEPELVIETYELHRDLIDSTEPTSREERYAITRLVSEYAYMLMYKHRYSTALPYINRGIRLWEVHENEWEKPLKEIERYEDLRFKKGVALARLKKLKEARTEFEWLLQYYPQNEMYQEWMRNLKMRWVGYTATTVLLIGAFSFIPRFLFGDSPIADIGVLVFKVCMVAYFSLWAFNYFMNKSPKAL